jgi:hypothetical protein
LLSPVKPPNENIFFGDYTNVTAHNGIVRPIWTRLHDGELSIWTHLVNESDFTTSIPIEFPTQSTGLENFPNPSENIVYVSFKLHERSTINLSILDAQGNFIKKIIAHEKRDYGKYMEKIDVKSLNIPSGVYVLQLKINGKTETVKQVVIN